MTYAAVADVRKRLANANLGVAGTSMYDDTALAEAIAEADGMINFALDLTTNTTDARFTPILKKICIDICAMFILQARHFKEQNEVEGVVSYWQATPEFTYVHRRTLNKIRNKMYGTTTSYNMHSGRFVS